MTTYQDIVDYMNKGYYSRFTLVRDDPGYTISNNKDDVYANLYINIDEDSYATNTNVDKGLGQLLVDILNTPVNQRNKPEIKHTIKPVTKENVDTANPLTRLTNVDQVIWAINTFIVSTRCTSNPIMTIATNVYNLTKVLKLYDDYNIKITNQMPMPNYKVFNLLIEPK